MSTKIMVFMVLPVYLVFLLSCAKPQGECSMDDTQKADYCFFQLAKEKNDPEKCSSIKLESMANACYSSIGVAKKDVAVCGKVTDLEEKNYCIKSIS